MMSVKQAAAVMNVSERLIYQIRRIRRESPVLYEAVVRGEVSPLDAHRSLGKPAAVIEDALECVQSGEARTLAEAFHRSGRTALMQTACRCSCPCAKCSD